jgi:hypothetical protein
MNNNSNFLGQGWLNLEESKKLFVLIFHRNPTEKEVELLATPNSVTSLRLGLRQLPEYRYWLAYDYLSTFRNLLVRQPMVFFRHLPRSGGTRFRAILEDLTGLPAILIGNREETHSLDYNFFSRGLHYPLIAGHVPFNYVYDNFTEITLLREPKSRILSGYRLLRRENNDFFLLNGINDINDFLNFTESCPIGFDFSNYGNSIQFAAYSFHRQSQEQLLQNIFGKDFNIPNLLDRIYPDNVINSSKVKDISEEIVDKNLLEKVCEREYEFLEALFESRILTPIPEVFENHLQDTIFRLGFRIQ